MKALIVIDFQKGFVEMGNFKQEKANVRHLIKEFTINKQPIIFFKHVDENPDSLIAYETEGSELDADLREYADYVIEKKTPSAFYQTNLDELLRSFDVSHVFITGFNTEYCPQFTAIAAFDRGYQVTFIEDATATVNDDQVYGFPGLDIRDFVSTVLHASQVIEVIDMEEYEEIYEVEERMDCKKGKNR